MILIDFNQIALANVYVFSDELKGITDQKAFSNILRHGILSTILSYKKKHHSEYGDVVICADGQNYWRKDIFPQYKFGRKESREASDLDWTMIFSAINEIRESLKQFFPYRVIHLDKTETDDTIGVLVKYSQDNLQVNTGLMEEAQPILIISSDGDFKQLHKYRNVRQYSPIQNKYVTSSASGIKYDYWEKIVKGDSGDGIPNIRSPDNQFSDNLGRQKSIKTERIDQFLKDGIKACLDSDEETRFKRNLTLIDFDYIPQNIRDGIISEYINNEPRGNRMTILAYLQLHRCRKLIDVIEEF